MNEIIIREAVKKIEEDGLIDVLKNCPNIMSRLTLLSEVFPEIKCWDSMSARKLVYRLQRKHGIDFGVCDFYSIEGNEQFCSANGEKCICLCAIPEAYCVFRDGNAGPKYPELSFIRVLESIE